jgi:hypothetical protein
MRGCKMARFIEAGESVGQHHVRPLAARPRKTGIKGQKPKPAKAKTKSGKATMKTVVTPIKTRRFPMSEHMEQAAQGMMKMYEEINAFARASVDANVKSMEAATKGWDESARSANHMMQENIARMMSIGKTVAEAKSMREIVDMQQEFVKDCLDLWMAGAGKISEISARTAKDVIEPVAQHANNAISRMMQKTDAA